MKKGILIGIGVLIIGGLLFFYLQSKEDCGKFDCIKEIKTPVF